MKKNPILSKIQIGQKHLHKMFLWKKFVGELFEMLLRLGSSCGFERLVQYRNGLGLVRAVFF